MSHECLKSLSAWFWISRNFLLEMGGGGVKQPRVRTQKGGEYQVYICVRGERGSNFSRFRAYLLIE